MKLYRAYKKQSSSTNRQNMFKTGLACLCFIFIFFPFVFSLAQTASELNNKISQKNADITKLEQEINQYQKQLNNLGKQKNSLSTLIKELDLTKRKLITDMSITQNKIDKTNLKIKELSLQINHKEKTITNNIKVLSLDIKKINELEMSDIWITLLSENSFTTTWNDINSISVVGTILKEETEKLRDAKIVLEDIRNETDKAKRELLNLKSKLSDQKKIVDQNTSEKKKLLNQTKNNESNYQKLLRDRSLKKEAFEKEIENYESQLKYILDPSKLPRQGIFSWPLDYIYITQSFGKTEAGKKLYVNGTHNGIDLRAPMGTPVKAMASGTIAGIGDTDTQCYGVSFGKFILIKYDNGLASTYGHLSLIKVSIGERVIVGQVVGYSGNTGYSTGPHLHVSVYPKDAVEVKIIPSKFCPKTNLILPVAPTNAYLDPIYYLPPYTQSLN